MLQLFNIFWQICLLRGVPQQLPASRFLLVLTLMLHILLDLLFALFTLPLFHAAAASLFNVALLFAFIHVLLKLTHKSTRFLQTLTALLGSGLVLGMLALPLTIWFYSINTPEARLLPSMLTLGLIIWGMLVTGHILRHALDVHQSLALLLAFAYTLLSYNLMGLLFPY
ncbi:MAG: hypothetical protein WCX90_06625 [Thiohalomonadaceae bacterium]